MDEKELLQIIAQAKEEGWTQLNLSEKELTSLPPEIGRLSRLTELNLSHNELTVLPPEIGQLTELKSLSLNGNGLARLPQEIWELTNLTKLNVADTRLTILPPEIGRLTNLIDINLGVNRLKTLPPEIRHLTNLHQIELHNNNFVDVPLEICHLTSLTSLSLGNTSIYKGRNKITVLPPEIGQLINLTELYLANLKLSTLPLEIRSLSSLQALDLEGNPLPVPPEILKDFSDPKRIYDFYFKVDAQARPLNEAKVLVLGQGGVGKTSLIDAMTCVKEGKPANASFNPDEAMTEGIIISRWDWSQSQGDSVRLNVWDFGGQEIMHATHQFFLTERSVYVIVIDARTDAQANRLDYWLKLVQSYGGVSPVIVVINKIDQHRLRLAEDDWKKRYPQTRTFVETSCFDGSGIQDLINAIQSALDSMQHVRDLLPDTWFNVKRQLTDMSDNAISYSQYQQMCEEDSIKDESEQNTLLRFLHDLGTVLHYEGPALYGLNVLNPRWVTGAAYKILNAPQINRADGILRYRTLSDVLDRENYPRESYNFILELMKKFELLFELEEGKYLLPDLLPPETPVDLKWDEHRNLQFRLKYDILPSSIISRFIVRAHALLEAERYWRTGAVLGWKGCRALVRGNLDEGTIDISVLSTNEDNSHLRRELLSAIRTEFRNIQQNLKGLVVEELVPIPGYPNAKSAEYEHLLSLYSRGKDDYDPVGIRKTFSVRELLDGVASAQQQQTDGIYYEINIGGDMSGKMNLADGDMIDIRSISSSKGLSIGRGSTVRINDPDD